MSSPTLTAAGPGDDETPQSAQDSEFERLFDTLLAYESLDALLGRLPLLDDTTLGRAVDALRAELDARRDRRMDAAAGFLGA